MTVKRFIYDEFEDCIIDNLTGKTHWGLDDILTNKLNELHEENKKLKQVNEMLSMDFAMTERNLIEENEQLKKQLNSFKPIIFEDINDRGCSILYEKELEE